MTFLAGSGFALVALAGSALVLKRAHRPAG
jgi:hypothetical protein